MDSDEVAHHEPPHQDLHCLQIQLFSSLVLKMLIPEFLLPTSHRTVNNICFFKLNKIGSIL